MRLPSPVHSIVSLRKRVATRGSFEAVRESHHTGQARFTKHLQLKDTETLEGPQNGFGAGRQIQWIKERDYADTKGSHMLCVIVACSFTALAEDGHGNNGNKGNNGNNDNGSFESGVIGSATGASVGGVGSGGAPWVVKSGEASISSSGQIRVEVQGLLIATGGPANLVGIDGSGDDGGRLADLRRFGRHCGAGDRRGGESIAAECAAGNAEIEQR